MLLKIICQNEIGMNVELHMVAKAKSQKADRFMVCVVEYGENIGTLRNLFPDFQQAQIFAEQIIALSSAKYEAIGPNYWYCSEKKEYVKIEGN
jgi:hypothetical protein